MELRRYRPGDEEEIVRVIRESMPVFEAYGLTPEEWLAPAPGVRPENTYVAVVDGRIVSVVQVVERSLVLGASAIRVAGIANVSTLPGYRGRGIATSLLRHALAGSSEKGLRAAALFAGLGSPAYRIYRGLGFDAIHVFATPVCMVDELRRVAEYCWRRAGGFSGGAPGHEALYSLYLERYNGMASRSRSHWDWVWEERPWYTWFCLGPEGYRLVELSGGGGYALYASWSRTRLASRRDRRLLHVGEMLFSDWGGACMLVEMLIREAEREGARGVVFHAPRDYWFLRPCPSMAPGEVFMLRMPAPIPEMIPASLPLPGSLAVRMDGRSICIPRGACSEADAEIHVPRDVFYRVLLGAMDPREAAEQGLLAVRPRSEQAHAVEILGEAVGGKGFHVWVTDRW